MGGAVFLFDWLFSLKHPSTKAYWLLGRASSCGRMEASRRVHANECSPELCCQCHFPCSKPQPLPTSKEDPPVEACRSFQFSYEVTALFPESWCMLDLVGALQEWSFCFSSPVEFLQSNPAGLQNHNLWGLFLLLPGPKPAKPDMEIKTFTLMGELLWYQYFPVYESPT